MKLFYGSSRAEINLATPSSSPRTEFIYSWKARVKKKIIHIYYYMYIFLQIKMFSLDIALIMRFPARFLQWIFKRMNNFIATMMLEILYRDVKFEFSKSPIILTNLNVKLVVFNERIPKLYTNTIIKNCTNLCHLKLSIHFRKESTNNSRLYIFVYLSSFFSLHSWKNSVILLIKIICFIMSCKITILKNAIPYYKVTWRGYKCRASITLFLIS